MEFANDNNCSYNKNGWIVCLSSFLINCIKNSLVFCFGVFIAEFKKIYGTDMSILDWIGVTVISSTDLLGPIPTLIIRKIGSKGYAICSMAGTLLLTVGCFTSSMVDRVEWLFLTFSITFGIGCCFIFLSSTLIISEFFPPTHRHHVLATSTFPLSYPIAIMLSCPLYAWIINITSWSSAFMVGGVKIFLLGSICSALFLLRIPAKKENNKKSEQNNEDELNTDNDDKLDAEFSDIWKTPERILWLLGSLLLLASQLGPILNLPHYMEHKGYNKVESALPLISLSMLELITTVILMVIGDKFKGKLIYFSILSCMMFSIFFCIWAAINPSFIVIMILSAILGIVEGASLIYVYPATLESMNMKADTAWTAFCLASGIGSFLCPVTTGAVFDYSGSYEMVYYAAAALCLVTCLVFSGIPIARYFKRKRKCSGYEDQN